MLTAKVIYQDSKEWDCTVTDENGKAFTYGMKHREESLSDFMAEVRVFTNIEDLAEHLSPCCCDEDRAYCYQHRSMWKKSKEV